MKKSIKLIKKDMYNIGIDIRTITISKIDNYGRLYFFDNMLNEYTITYPNNYVDPYYIYIINLNIISLRFDFNDNDSLLDLNN